MSRAVKVAMHADGVFVAANNIVSQSVPHLHVHVVPRKHKDGLRGFFWPRRSTAARRPTTWPTPSAALCRAGPL